MWHGSVEVRLEAVDVATDAVAGGRHAKKAQNGNLSGALHMRKRRADDVVQVKLLELCNGTRA